MLLKGLHATFFFVPILATAGPHKELDLREQSDADGEYTVSPCARPSPGASSLPGHAFVMYSYRSLAGDRRILSLGFMTNSAVKGVLSYIALLATPVGYPGEEHYTAAKEECLVLMVNKADFMTAMAIAKPFYNIPTLEKLTYSGIYSLTQNDCITFMFNVANRFASQGVVIPKRDTRDLPLVYLRKLIDAN
ncbi:hypothetical protein UNDKW_5977 (plasmid) [Undibacterium sp. KW1]|uniref:hypothetical protein n=1 Tax=Undibacterium sp. KW1 TaxID=2058624 RepID=UPI001331F203|nr:hypothetical protein [Undibacterium sp. KW1]BBB64250.1 hypothetical protein UNDKW_5977 [Undibacterium sp. KW1]